MGFSLDYSNLVRETGIKLILPMESAVELSAIDA